MATEFIVLLAPICELKLLSIVPSGASLTIRLAAFPLKVVKLPPITIFPSGWIAPEVVQELNPEPGLKEASKLPSVFRRAMWFIGDPLNTVKAPAAINFPSDWATTAFK